MNQPRLLWTPSEEFIEESNLTSWIAWLRKEKNLKFDSYSELWVWSTTDIETFWTYILEYFDVIREGISVPVLSGAMPRVKWFEGLILNYTEHIFRHNKSSEIAIVFQSEDSPTREISWADLKKEVAGFQKFLIDSGIGEGDRVVAYIPCIPEATAAFLATCSIGAVWSSCSPDFGTQSVIDRFAQIQPKVLIAVDSYTYGGKSFDKTDTLTEVVKSLPSVENVVLLRKNKSALPFKYTDWEAATGSKAAHLQFKRVPFNHPIWIVYSSGTTGLPKAITHSQGGILLEQLKYLPFHNDVKPGERFFWYTTTGWMMWNYLQAALLCGATMVLYDGSPTAPNLSVLWKFIQDVRITHFGTSAGFLLSCMKAELNPGKDFDLTSLRSISSTGSTLPPEGFDWVYEHVKKNIWLVSMSGGTDVASAFVGGNPTGPVYSGEIQCRALGCSLEAYSEDGKALIDEVGEMVINKPMPSMPIYFWNDPEFKRYHESYFEMFPGIWRHGDWIEITSRDGVIIYGRSDATLNRGGVRIGTSEIYRAMDKIHEVRDSLIVCVEKDKGEFYMPLFVVMTRGQKLTDDLRKKINSTIRTDYSPRHVPDEIISVPDIPYTISGKKTETPVKKVLMGKDPKQVVNFGALRNPDSIHFFIEFYRTKKQVN